ncbi:hypothetical protein [Priestia megaterium]|uniref:hypothetical protein n=1 Tax=Priestia megaterium TaxID=1404 RepID=UPI000D50AAB0|nr:hypothetical protein [Priestia megaterium]PVE62905.1 hypothetical protein DC428_25295 [Priestia megaterium]PVE79549.1 hypothetical protein DC421_25275 [Priestia megaterium]PVE81849.1 hypothetical protein DC426_23950 [Priestia megaterium]PVE94266.1 hypothetical protein DC433_25775 [Priestia megaterium]
MGKQQLIKDLQHKALNGDEQALDLYNEYVNRGEAPRIVPKQQFKSTVETRSMMSAGYEQNATNRGDDLFISQPRELTEEDVMKSNSITKIAYGYGQRVEAVAKYKAKRRDHRKSLDNPKANFAEKGQ